MDCLLNSIISDPDEPALSLGLFLAKLVWEKSSDPGRAGVELGADLRLASAVATFEPNGPSGTGCSELWVSCPALVGPSGILEGCTVVGGFAGCDDNGAVRLDDHGFQLPYIPLWVDVLRKNHRTTWWIVHRAMFEFYISTYYGPWESDVENWDFATSWSVAEAVFT